MKRNATKQIRNVKNDCSWFDTDNARLIILCALFGFVGAHKFAQGKNGQGWLFIILDLTIVGIIVSAVWAFIDLLFLTIKQDNKPGNMILGSVFLLFGMILPLSFGCSGPAPTVIEVGKVSSEQKKQNVAPQKVDEFGKDQQSKEQPLWQGNLKCETPLNNPHTDKKSMDVFVELYKSKAVLNLENSTIIMPLETTEIEDSHAIWVYKGDNDENRLNLSVNVENGEIHIPNSLYDAIGYGTLLLYFAPKKVDGVEYGYTCYKE